jgi:repressor LexA
MINNDIISIYYDKGDKKMIGDKVKELRKLLGMTQKDLADKLGLKSQTTIAAIESNKNKPSNELLSKMADLFKVSTDFLLGKIEQDGGYLRLLFSVKLNEKMKNENFTVEELSNKLNISGRDLMCIKNAQLDRHAFSCYKTVAEYIGYSIYDLHALMSNTYKALKSDIVDETEEDLIISSKSPSIMVYDFINIPILGVVRAGLPILAAENIEGHIPLPCSMISDSKDYFALRVHGDSMNSEFKEGSIIVVEKTNIIENGEIAVILVNGNEATVKKVVQNSNMITLIPMSSNPIHTPTMYDMVKDEIQIVGKVKHAIKSY